MAIRGTGEPRRRGRFIAAAAAVVLGVLTLAAPSAARVALTSGSPTRTLQFTQSAHVNFTLEGCRNNGTITFPSGGPFICPDSAYTTGNLGKGWNELDLVPHRLTTSAGNQGATTSYNVVIAADYFNGSGKFGYDVISVPQVNSAKSDASCSVSADPAGQQISNGGVTGGAQQTIYRTLTISQNAGTTCVFDYYQRLALGAHLFSGSSLQSYMFEKDDFSTGKRTLSIPVNQILPQQLSKDMSATQGSDHTWDITKSASSANLSFPNTCDASSAHSAGVQITITWHKLAASPNGDITVVTHVYATNPAARAIDISVSDAIRSGTTVLDTTSAVVATLNANSTTLLITHTVNVPSGTTDLNDIATASYTDNATGIPVPGNTTATASATVQSSGPALNQNATVSDSESSTGFPFSADSFSGASGSFDGGYVAGTHTNGPVGWTSALQSDSGSVTFNKTVYTGIASGTGSLSDTATLTGSDGFTASAQASVAISANATVGLTISKSIPNVLQNGETASFTFDVHQGSAAGTIMATKTLSFGAGETGPKTASVSGLTPGTYVVTEQNASGWQPQSAQTLNLDASDSDHCSGTATFSNTPNPPTAQVRKITVPAGSEGGWSFDLHNPSGTVVETVSTTNANYVNFTTPLSTEGTWTITEQGKTGWEFVSSSGCSITVNLPSATSLYSCDFTNRALGKIIVRKVTNPTSATQKFTFNPSYGSSFQLGNGESNDSGFLTPGSGYSVSETAVTGWDLTSATCDNGNSPSAIAVNAGQTVTCTFTNTQRGSVQVIKTENGAVPTIQYTFRLSGGPDNVSTTLSTNSTNQGTLNFGSLLKPGSYTLCEILVPAGTTSTLQGLPGATVNTTTGDICVPFTLAAGESKVFTIDNQHPLGGQRTIGYWKNWSTCTGGNQVANAAKTGHALTDDLLPIVLVPSGLNYSGLTITTCSKAVEILGNASTKYAEHGLAAQLLGALLNRKVAGGVACTAANQAIGHAQDLLGASGIKWNGSVSSSVVGSNHPLRSDFVNTMSILDQFNNEKLC